jgi:N-acyl-D-amino-acid deacylase
MGDLLIKNGNIIDGSGSPAYMSDIAVKKGKIERIGPSLDIKCEKSN